MVHCFVDSTTCEYLKIKQKEIDLLMIVIKLTKRWEIKYEVFACVAWICCLRYEFSHGEINTQPHKTSTPLLT